MSETVTSQAETLLMEKDGPIGWITFNQPHKRNAVSQEMWQRMPEYARDFSTDSAIRVVILRGAGETAFVAGADISQFKDRRRNAADEEEYRRISAAGSESLATLGKPLLAMIHGFCIGGGVSIAISISGMRGRNPAIRSPGPTPSSRSTWANQAVSRASSSNE